MFNKIFFSLFFLTLFAIGCSQKDKAQEYQDAKAQKYFDEGINAFRLGLLKKDVECQTVLDYFDKAEKAGFQDMDKINQYRAGLYNNCGDIDQAIASSTRCINLNPNNSDCYYQRYLAYSKLWVASIDRETGQGNMEIEKKMKNDRAMVEALVPGYFDRLNNYSK